MSTPTTETDGPAEVLELAARAVDYVVGALGIELEFDSETLPILDHYLRTIPEGNPETADLIASVAGAYFGEVIRRRLGGQWKTVVPEAVEWSLELPGGLWFVPGQMVLAAIHQTDEYRDNLNPPAKMRSVAEQALGRMTEVSEDNYYSLCGRFDTLEHLQAVLLAIAVQEAERRADAN
jgi:hypothetical protein